MTDWLADLHVFCADIGSIPNGRFAWARRLPGGLDEIHDPARIESLVDAVAAHLVVGRPAALGFEMPLFVPVPEEPMQIGKARPCDVDAPAWSSSVGASVLATGIPQVAWALQRLRAAAPTTELHLSWPAFAAARSGLLVWEAFVTRSAKGATHEEDAAIGVDAFCSQLPSPGDLKADATPRPLSILAAAAMWAGWDLDADQLRRSVLVVRA